MRGCRGAAHSDEPAYLADDFLHDLFSGKRLVNTKLNIKRIIMCADDFGMNSAIDEGILHLARLGRLSATSCLVQGPTFKTSAPALKLSGLQLGLHLNFTEAMDQAGLYYPVNKLIAETYLRRLDTARVRKQVTRQLDVFESVLGQAPDYVDGHQHVHQFPQIREMLLLELARRYSSSLPALRYTRARSAPGVSLGLPLKALLIQLLGARRFAQLARNQGFSLNGRFLGVYDFQGGKLAYESLLFLWLRSALDGDLLMCHPACQNEGSDSLGLQRLAEFEVLASDRTGLWFEQFGIRPGVFPKGGAPQR